MVNLYDDEQLSREQRGDLNFALAKAYEDLQDYEHAYTHYAEGNAIRKAHMNYDQATDEDAFSKLKLSYPEIRRSSLAGGPSEKHPTPVFVVGMPRSGTTLVEQIISSHPNVKGAGELDFIGRYGAQIALGATRPHSQALTAFRTRYLDEIAKISDRNLMVIDKTPQNFRYLGLIAASFPEAKIIHVWRDPAAVCWANYKTYFTSPSLGYSYDLDDTVRYFEMYADLMRFWQEQVGDRFYGLDYDRLTTEFEDETRRLIAYLDLEWDDRCLSPHLNENNVVTASSVQIRRKVYKNSSRRWKTYEPFLKGKLDHLDQFQR